jgi:hypothetical protein
MKEISDATIAATNMALAAAQAADTATAAAKQAVKSAELKVLEAIEVAKYPCIITVAQGHDYDGYNLKLGEQFILFFLETTINRNASLRFKINLRLLNCKFIDIILKGSAYNKPEKESNIGRFDFQTSNIVNKYSFLIIEGKILFINFDYNQSNNPNDDPIFPEYYTDFVIHHYSLKKNESYKTHSVGYLALSSDIDVFNRDTYFIIRGTPLDYGLNCNMAPLAYTFELIFDQLATIEMS